MKGYNSLRFKVFTSQIQESQLVVYPAPRGQIFTKASIPFAVSQFVALLEAQFPGNIFKVVPMGGNRFSVIPNPPSA